MVDLGSIKRHLPSFLPGSVWLVGGGPGDPGLLTASAIYALQSADIVVYDALISDEILTIIPEYTAIECAGKRGGKPSSQQFNITHRLIGLAQAGRRVVRLKGGDPFVFGRGGGRGDEEALALADAGVPFRIVPGITAGIGGLAAAHIPVTMRATNHAVVLMTGHRATNCEEETDWRPWVQTGSPIVLYMAMSNLGAIVSGLIRAGMNIETPVAVVANASRSDQRVLVSHLCRVVADVQSNNFEAPAIIVVGSIVDVRAALLANCLVAENVF